MSTPQKIELEHPTVIFDGVCNFCNGAVNFIIKRDPEARIRFSPMQSDYAQALMNQHGVDQLGLNTFVYINNSEVYIRSTAALELLKKLNGAWPMLSAFKIIPRPLRDVFYRVIAHNRYRWFGKRESCIVPDSATRARFIF